MMMKNLSISLALIIGTIGLVLVSGCIGEDKSSTKSEARVSTTEIEEETPTSTPITTKGDAKIAPWRLPPIEEGVIVNSGGGSRRSHISYDYSDEGELREKRTVSEKTDTWLDENGNPLYTEETTISYEPLKKGKYGTVQARIKTITFNWKGMTADRGILFGTDPNFSPAVIVFISENESYYSYVTIENKGMAGDVTLIVDAKVIQTGDAYTFSKVFHMDKGEKVKAVVHFPKSFPRETLVYIEPPLSAQTSKDISWVGLEVRPSSKRDKSQGEINIERI